MAIAYGGRRGDTEHQIASTMHFDADQKHLHAAMSEIRRTLAGSAVPGKLELAIANGVRRSRTTVFVVTFSTCADSYGAVVEFLDFPASPAGAVAKVNGWIARQTKNKINAAMPPGAVTDNTRLVIANAIYFKGDWASRFPAQQTRPGASGSLPKRPSTRQRSIGCDPCDVARDLEIVRRCHHDYAINAASQVGKNSIFLAARPGIANHFKNQCRFEHGHGGGVASKDFVHPAALRFNHQRMHDGIQFLESARESQLRQSRAVEMAIGVTTSRTKRATISS